VFLILDSVWPDPDPDPETLIQLSDLLSKQATTCTHARTDLECPDPGFRTSDPGSRSSLTQGSATHVLSRCAALLSRAAHGGSPRTELSRPCRRILGTEPSPESGLYTVQSTAARQAATADEQWMPKPNTAPNTQYCTEYPILHRITKTSTIPK